MVVSVHGPVPGHLQHIKDSTVPVEERVNIQLLQLFIFIPCALEDSKLVLVMYNSNCRNSLSELYYHSHVNTDGLNIGDL